MTGQQVLGIAILAVFAYLFLFVGARMLFIEKPHLFAAQLIASLVGGTLALVIFMGAVSMAVGEGWPYW